MNLVQYVVLRGDLNWNTGSLIAQGCHASIAAITKGLNESDTNTINYVNDLSNMRKVVLKANDEKSINQLKETLDKNNIKHHLWIEQPENLPSCLATYPIVKDEVSKYFKEFKLYKN